MARVLIADDDSRFRSLARRTVAARGHLVIEAPDAASALRLARREKPEIALLDVHLGADSGWTLAAQLEAIVPRIIMLSSDPDAGHGAPDGLRDRIAFAPKPALAGLAL